MLIALLAGCSPPEPVPAPPAPAAQPTPAPAEPPGFQASARPLTDSEREAMVGVSWKPGCPVPLDQLVLLSFTHHGFDGQPAEGRLVVHAEVAEVVQAALEAAWEEGFQIERAEPIEAYDGSDQRSMAANNTSAFNCRQVTGGTTWSEHSHGHAIDVNPVQNPYISASGRTVLPEAGQAYLDRSERRPGMLFDDSALVQTLRTSGWGWGGQWRRARDYQHLSATGR